MLIKEKKEEKEGNKTSYLLNVDLNAEKKYLEYLYILSNRTFSVRKRDCKYYVTTVLCRINRCRLNEKYHFSSPQIIT